MLQLFSSVQVRKADAYTIQNEPVSSIDLMERAAAACVEWMNHYQDLSTKNIMIFCGPGNNGGDGLAIARMLHTQNIPVIACIPHESAKFSEDFSVNLERAKKCGVEIRKNDKYSPEWLSGNTIIVDALFGSGLSKPLEGIYNELVKLINQSKCITIAIDIPSGLYADRSADPNRDAIVKSDYTLSFQFPKLAFLFPENFANVGDFEILDIGLSNEYTRMTSCKNHFVVKSEIKELLQTRNKNAHKGNFGHALIVAGSKGKIGAAVLSTQACMRTGAGLVTVHTPACGYEIIQISVPEAMVHADSEADFITDSIKTETYNAIGVGPGIGMEKQTQNILKLFIQNSNSPMVFDADAINILAENKTWLSFLPTNSILTPHIKEFERLVGKATNTQDRLKQQVDFAIKYNVIVVLKGAYSSVATPQGELFFNSTGNPGMATGGSGDVLTGIITSLLAQGYSAFHASIIGVFLHGTAGDCASNQQTEETMIASDIIENISQAYSTIRAISI